MKEEDNRSTKLAWHNRDWVSPGVTAVWAVLVVVTVFRPYLHPIGQHWMEYQEDDFYYYLKIATNVISGSGSTFNGLVPTNGFHPLWMLMLAAVLRISQSWQIIFGFLSVAITLSTFATFSLANRLLRAAAVPRLVRTALAMYVATFSLHLFESGMEVILALPLLFAVAAVFEREEYWRRGFAQAASLGLLWSATILARLDTAILAAVLLGGLVGSAELRRKLNARQVAGIAVGLSPVALYLFSNLVWFHTLLPVSGMAKQLKPISMPSPVAWQSLLDRRALREFNLLLPLLGFVPLVALWKRLTAIRRLLYTALLMFPYAYLLTLSTISGWKLWDWYMYPFWPAMCIMFMLYATWRPSERVLRLASVGALICVVVLAETWRAKRNSAGMEAMYTVGEQVAAFAKTHPGIYAMGDRSGIVGYLLPQPLVQTEGLVMDRDFLRRIKQKQSLREVLAAYGTRYFVASGYGWHGGCFKAAEPYQVGPESPHMEALFCEQPVATLKGDPVTLIYDLRSTGSSKINHFQTGAPSR